MIFNLTQPVLDSAPKFTYTGTYEYIDDGGGNWRIKFLTSGVFTPLRDIVIDAFLVGGGGGSPIRILGGWSSGAGGGYTRTDKGISLTANAEYPIIVGAGGVGTSGNDTSAFGNVASGGKNGNSSSNNVIDGGNGGSGGGQLKGDTAYDGGSDGSNGGRSFLSQHGGVGQGTTTREFGEETGTLYAGGGGAYNSRSIFGKGGLGGGADGGTSAMDNTGGGAGGADNDSVTSGGSGIVVIRKHKEAAA